VGRDRRDRTHHSRGKPVLRRAAGISRADPTASIVHLLPEFIWKTSYPPGRPPCRNVQPMRPRGLTAETLIATLEDAEDYQAFETAVTSDYDAASVLWRFRRATSIETAPFESATAEPGKIEHGSSHPTLVAASDRSHRSQYTWYTHGNLTRLEASSGPVQERISRRASCSWPLCRLSPLTASELPAFALATGSPDCVYARIVAAPQATA
jgi:hypothetical protein